MRPVVVFMVVGLGGCFSKPTLSPAEQDAVQSDGDGTAAADAAPDALACATFGLWSTPTIMPGINAAAIDDHMAALSPDGSLLVFSSQRTGGGDLYVTRFDPSMASPVTAISSLTTPTEERDPAWSADGTQLYFNRGGELMVSDVDLTIYPPFKAPGPAADLMALGVIKRPRFSPDGLEVFFSMNFPEEIFRSTRVPGGTWRAPALVAEIASPGDRQIDPILSGDGLTLYFVSSRISGSVLELFQATRVDSNSPFGSLSTALTVVMRHPEISRDGRTLVFSRYTVTQPDLFVTQRSCQ